MANTIQTRVANEGVLGKAGARYEGKVSIAKACSESPRAVVAGKGQPQLGPALS